MRSIVHAVPVVFDPLSGPHTYENGRTMVDGRDNYMLATVYYLLERTFMVGG